MGPIYDRTRAPGHDGRADHPHPPPHHRRGEGSARHGIIPPGVDEPEIYRQRSGGVILPRSADWWDATQDLRRAFVDRSEMAEMATLGNA